MAELPKNIQEISDKKQEYIDQNRDRLESNVVKMQEDLLNRLIEDILPELETKDGQILNTQKNMRLIEVLDTVYSQFNQTNQTKTVKTLGETLTGLSKFNNNYFGSIALNEVGKKRFDQVTSKTEELMKTTIGIDKNGSVSKGGFLDSFITDNTLLTELKQMLIRNVTGQQSIADFKTSLKEKVVGTDKVSGGFEKYYRQYAYDVYQNYDRAYGKSMADEFKLNHAIYQGGIIKDSRDFCKAHEGQVYTREEIAEFGNWKLPKDSEESPGGGEVPNYIAKFPNYDPFTSLGGWGCRHSLSWITKSMAERLRPELNHVIQIKIPKEEKPIEVFDYTKELDTLRKEYSKAIISGDIDGMGRIGNRMQEISKIVYSLPKSIKEKKVSINPKLKNSKPNSKGLTIDQAREAMDNTNFTEDEKKAVNTYTKGNYTQINTYLRGQRNNISDENTKVITQLDEFIKKAPKVEAETYRGLSFGEKDDFDNFIKLKKGNTFTDKAFMSTTYDKNIGQTFTNMDPYRINMTIKGKNGVYIENLSDAKKEKEIIFGKGSKFKINTIKTVKRGNGFATVDIELTEI